jgi:hypothetical protein
MIRADIDHTIDECADRDYKMIIDRKTIMRLVEKSNKNLIPAENILRNRLKKIGGFRDELNRIYSEMGNLRQKKEKFFKEEAELEGERGAMIDYA